MGDVSAHVVLPPVKRRRRPQARRSGRAGRVVVVAGMILTAVWATVEHRFPSGEALAAALPLSILLCGAGVAAGWYAQHHRERVGLAGARHEHASELWREVGTGFIAGSVISFAFNGVATDIESRRSDEAQRLEDVRAGWAERLENLRFVRSSIIATVASPDQRRFDGLDLQEMTLAGLPLEHARLNAAVLDGANLARADLRSADLRRASLRLTNLYETDLREANLSDADLLGARLRRADLRGATLIGARLTPAVGEFSGGAYGGTSPDGQPLVPRERYQDAQFLPADLAEVVYDDRTRWPEGFTPPADAVKAPN